MAKIMRPPYTKPAQEGEIRQLKFLQDNLPENYILIPNGVYAVEQNGNVTPFEYDCIVIAPHGIFNIENKDFSGDLGGDQYRWWHKGKEMQNPLTTCREKTKILVALLKKKNWAWGSAWIDSLVTLSNPKQNKAGFSDSDPSTRQIFLLDEELIDYLKKPKIINGKEVKNIEKYQEDIADFLTGNNFGPPPVKKKILEFNLERILSETADYQEYLVCTDGVVRQQKRVRVYNLFSPGMTEEQKDTRKKCVLNQNSAFQKIESFNHIARVECRVEENQVFEISDFVDAKTLRSVMAEKVFTDQEKFDLIFQLCCAVKAAHEAGVFHRAINPENICIVHDNLFLANFNQAYFAEHSTGNYTVQAGINKSNVTPYQAPELADGDAGKYSDIYSIGVILYELFVGKTPVQNFYDLASTGGIPAESLPSKHQLPGWLDSIIEKTVTVDPDKRYQEVEELEKALREHLDAPQPAEEPNLPQEVQVGSKVTESLFLVEQLGQGGFSKVFRAHHKMTNEESAIKIFNASVPIESVLTEFHALHKLDNDHIVKFYSCDQLGQGQYYVQMELLHGENLQKYLSGKGDLKLPLESIYQLAKEMLDALVYLQQQEPPIFHRDIKPQNIIWDEQKRFVLIDFNVATKENEDHLLTGTQPYLPVDLIVKSNHVEWDKSADTFSFGITLYELVCLCYPWEKSLLPLRDKTPIDPCSKNKMISRKFADFLLKSIVCDREKRFRNAEEMATELYKIGQDGIYAHAESALAPAVKGEYATSDFVKYLNTLYSQSRYGNQGTRSGKEISPLDSETYIETKLDSTLLQDICRGKYKLLIITGNAGDGKTAFIRKIEKRAEEVKHLAHANGASFKLKGIPFESNYDGSQNEADKVNAEVLREFFAPFCNQENFQKVSEGRIIAINEGVLADFLGKTAELKHLSDVIDDYFLHEGKSQLPAGLMIINLNLRSVTAVSEKSESLFRKQLKNICQHKFWSSCASCPNKEFCFIKYNVDTFNDYAAGNEVLNRIEWMLRMTVYRRELHITIRDLRSFISFLITADCRCEDIPKLYSERKVPEEYWKYYYFNLFAQDGLPSQDRLITLLRQMDIALVPLPNIDRTLYMGDLEKKFFIPFAERAQILPDQFDKRKKVLQLSDYTEKEQLALHRMLIRHHFFEGNFEFFKSTFFRRMPYKFLHKFGALMQGDHEVENDTRKALPNAFAHSAGCLNSPVIENYLLLPASHENDPYGKTYRRFPLSDFELLIERPDHLVTYVEYENSNAIFRHKDPQNHFIMLNITLDLFDMLFYIEEGFSPSRNDLQGRFLEMQVFRTRLENMSYQEVLITRDNKNFCLAKLDLATNKIHLSELEEVEK